MRLGASDLWSSTEGITRKVDQVLIHPLYNHRESKWIHYDLGHDEKSYFQINFQLKPTMMLGL